MKIFTVALLALAACGRSAGGAPQPAPAAARPPGAAGDSAAMARAHADSLRYPYTAADVAFMSHMIAHHAQAIVMSGWAPSHGADPAVQRLAARIVNAQQDEIATMQQWLRARRQPVPEATPSGVTMVMNGVKHEMLMPGMLTDAQMHALDESRGPAFDHLFLSSMIQHHRGAVSMVEQLFGTYGAAQDEIVFKFANDVNVDQTTEIARMESMLATLSPESHTP
jgi:uncharacterized protein (DUF305 family)